jgi:hypothetical protein
MRGKTLGFSWVLGLRLCMKIEYIVAIVGRAINSQYIAIVRGAERINF